MFARLENNIVVELIDHDDLTGRYTAAFIDSCVQCDSTVLIGDSWDGSGFYGRTLEEAKAEKLAAIQSTKNSVRDGGFTVAAVVYDSDAAARLAYLELGTKLSEDPNYIVTWKANDNPDYVTMDATLFAQVREASESHISAVFAWQAALVAHVLAAQTVEAVNAIEVSYT